MNTHPSVISEELLLRDVLESYKDEYGELSETWRNLDGKAQGTITVSGIFLAGVLTFINSSRFISTIQTNWLLTVATLLLTASVVLSLLVLRLRDVPAPPLGESLGTLLNDLLSAKDAATPERICDFIRDHANLWKSSNKKVNDVNQDKAKKLLWAQTMLVFAIVVAVFFILITVWSK